MSTRIYPLMTVGDLETLPDDGNRHELIGGELIIGEPLMTRPPALAHQFALDNLFFHLRTYLEQNPAGRVVTTPGVIFDKYNSVIPDVVLLTKEQMDRVGAEAHINEAPAPALVATRAGDDEEITSPALPGFRRRLGAVFAKV